MDVGARRGSRGRGLLRDAVRIHGAAGALYAAASGGGGDPADHGRCERVAAAGAGAVLVNQDKPLLRRTHRGTNRNRHREQQCKGMSSH